MRVTSSLASPAADPRLYESDVADALAVAEAGLVIENGAGYDTAPFQAPTVLIYCRAADGGGRRSLALAAPARLAVALTG